MPAIDNFWAVIPAGGAGTRLWPLSRSSSPKFLHDLTGSGQSLLQDTWTRLAPLAEDRFLVVTGRAHRGRGARAAARRRPGRRAGRAVAARLDGRDRARRRPARARRPRRRDGLVRGRPRDPGPRRVRRVGRLAVEAARDGWLVTLGIEPTFPSSAFGYIHLGERAGRAPRRVRGPGVRREAVHGDRGGLPRDRQLPLERRHVRGPPDRAARPAGRVAPGVRRHAARPRRGRLAARRAVARRSRRSPSTTRSPSRPRPRDAWWWCPPPSGGTTSATSTRWPACSGEDGDGIRVLGDAALVRAVDATGLVVPRSGRVVAVVGLDDVVVVDTPDALLVTTRAHAQRVKQVVTGLQQDDRADLT